MGIVVNQSFKNSLVIFLAFAIGGINTLFIYPKFLTDQYYGLVVFLLSTANLLMPLISFGLQFTIIKFFPIYETQKEKDTFLCFSLLLPLVIAIPIAFFGVIFYEKISLFLASENALISGYTSIIYLVAIATAYFEIFYSWAKVQLKSVFGNTIKELYHRVSTMILLFLLGLKIISVTQFIWLMTASYFLRTLIVFVYALKLYTPKLIFKIPVNFNEILEYSFYIILAGSAGAFLLDIDKFMLPQKEAIEYTAYYTVGVFIASVVNIPGRAMTQIIQPLTSKAIKDRDDLKIATLYKSSSINLLVFGGIIFLLINLNISDLYSLVPKSNFSSGTWVVFMVSLANLYTLFLGNNGAIISNSNYYKVLLPYGVSMAVMVSVLNYFFIDYFHMEGAAMSTLLVVVLFNSLKIWFVKKKLSIVPFSSKSWKLFGLIFILFGVFYFFKLSFHPILNILIKSLIITLVYFFLIKKMQISNEISSVLAKYKL